MTLTLQIPAELEGELLAEARRLAIPLEQYAMRLLLHRAAPPEVAVPLDGAELVTYWRAQGLVGCRPDLGPGPEHARQLRAEAERRLAR